MLENWLAYIGVDYAMTATLQAAITWRRIQRRPTNIRVRRGAALLDAQIVRIEEAASGEVQGDAARSAQRTVTVFGVVNHPDPTVPDTDLQRGDRFVYNNTEYRVIDVISYPGQVQVSAEAQS